MSVSLNSKILTKLIIRFSKTEFFEKNRKLFSWDFNTKEDAESWYNNVLTHIYKYHSNPELSSLAQKLDKLLSHIDLLPANDVGGKEFEEAKDRFDSPQ